MDLWQHVGTVSSKGFDMIATVISQCAIIVGKQIQLNMEFLSHNYFVTQNQLTLKVMAIR